MNKSWEMKTLGDLCEVVTKGTTPTSVGFDFVEKGINFIKIESIDENKNFIPKKFAAISKECHDSFRRSQLKKGDILFSIAGALGRIALVSDDILPANTNQALAIIRLKTSENVNTDFILLTLESGLIFDQINKFKGGVAQQNLSLEQVKSFRFPLPPRPEQKHIVTILNDVFEKTTKAKENAEKNLQNAHELFESYLQSVFISLGDGWETKKLGEVCEMINRGVSPKYTELKGLCVLNQKCIREHRVNFDLSRFHDLKNKKVSSDRFVQIGDVLVNSTGTGTLGRVAQISVLPVTATVDSHITIVRPTKNMFYNDFFGYALMFIEEGIAKRGEGCGGQTELARNTLKNDFEISYPRSLSQQKSIVAKLDSLSAETKKLEVVYQQKLADLDELRKSILQKAFNGELAGACL